MAYTWDDYLRLMGYSYGGEDGDKMYLDTGDGERQRIWNPEQLQDQGDPTKQWFDLLNKTDSQGRPVYGTEFFSGVGKPGSTFEGENFEGRGNIRYRLGQGWDQFTPEQKQQFQSLGLDPSQITYDEKYGYNMPMWYQDEWHNKFQAPGQRADTIKFYSTLFAPLMAAAGQAITGAAGSTAGSVFPSGAMEGAISLGAEGLGTAAGAGGAFGGLSQEALDAVRDEILQNSANWGDPNYFQNVGSNMDFSDLFSGINSGGLDGALGDSIANYTSGLGDLNPLTTSGGGGWIAGLLDNFGVSPSTAASIGKAILGGNSGSSNTGILGSLLGGNGGANSALLGGLLGYLSGRDQPQNTQNTDVPEWLKPYYRGGLDAGLSQLNASKNLTANEQQTIDQMLGRLGQPNAGLEAANKAMTDTASGNYLNMATNPQWQDFSTQLSEKYNLATRPATDQQFSRAGAFGVGNTAWQEYTGQNQADLARGLATGAANIYGQERERQMNAAGAMPGFQNQYLTGLGNSALQLGNYQRMQPWQGILNYGQLLGNLKGPSTTSQTQSSNPWQSALGGAMSGYALANMWR